MSFKLENEDIISIHNKMSQTHEDNKSFITNSEAICDENNNPLVASSLYTENIYPQRKPNLSKILSWPYIKPCHSFPFGKLRSFENTTVDSQIYEKLFINKNNTSSWSHNSPI